MQLFSQPAQVLYVQINRHKYYQFVTGDFDDYIQRVCIVKISNSVHATWRVHCATGMRTPGEWGGQVEQMAAPPTISNKHRLFLAIRDVPLNCTGRHRINIISVHIQLSCVILRAA